MLKNVPLRSFLLVYIGFSLIFHQAPLVSWLNRFTDFSTISGLSALLFIELLSFLLWVLLLTPFFIISIKLGKLIAVILLILNATALFWMTSLGVVMTKAVIASLFFTDYSEASGFLNVKKVSTKDTIYCGKGGIYVPFFYIWWFANSSQIIQSYLHHRQINIRHYSSLTKGTM